MNSITDLDIALIVSVMLAVPAAVGDTCMPIGSKCTV